MDVQRISRLLEPFVSDAGNFLTGAKDNGVERGGRKLAKLSSIQLDRISTYIDVLLRWNTRVNLTAIRSPEEIVTRHFGESLFAARQIFPWHTLEPGSSVRVADLGSGAGFPGLPIKLWAPHVSMTLIEPNHKKAAFLREVARALTLTNIDVQNVRAEAVTQIFDVVTLRAVERFADILPVAGCLTAPSGRLALLISTPQSDRARAVLKHFAWQPPLEIPESRSRVVLIGAPVSRE